jgi:hypothetical protein
MPRKKPEPKSFKQRVYKLREERGNKCECKRTECHGEQMPCGKGLMFKLEFAHVKPTGLTGLNGRGRGQTQRYYDIKNNPDAYELLCNSCHLEFDLRKGHDSVLNQV